MRYGQCLFAAALVVGALASTTSRAATTVTTISGKTVLAVLTLFVGFFIRFG